MSTLPQHWIAHRRDDGEVVGWIDMDSAAPALVPIDRLGRPLPAVDDWDEAESALEEVGLRVLLGRFVVDELLDSGGVRPVQVRIAHVYADRIVLNTALTDAVEEVGREIVVGFPAPESLRRVSD